MPRTKTHLQFRLVWLFVAVSIVAMCLSYRGIRLSYLAWTMSNTDVTSDGGSELRCGGPTKRIVEEFGLAARDILKTKLNDPERFAAAHVALADITNAKTGTTWHVGSGQFVYNRLNYSRNTNNALRFELTQNSHLATWWFDTVGEHVGIPLVDEESNELVWLNTTQNAR